MAEHIYYTFELSYCSLEFLKCTPVGNELGNYAPNIVVTDLHEIWGWQLCTCAF